MENKEVLREEFDKLLSRIREKNMSEELWLVGGSMEREGFDDFLVYHNSNIITVKDAYKILDGEE